MWVSWCSIQKFAPSKLWSLWGSGRLGLHGDSVLLMMRCSPSFGWRNQLWISLDSFSKWGGKNKQENCFLWPQVPPVPCGQAYLEYPERGRKHLPYPTIPNQGSLSVTGQHNLYQGTSWLVQVDSRDGSEFYLSREGPSQIRRHFHPQITVYHTETHSKWSLIFYRWSSQRSFHLGDIPVCWWNLHPLGALGPVKSCPAPIHQFHVFFPGQIMSNPSTC